MRYPVPQVNGRAGIVEMPQTDGAVVMTGKNRSPIRRETGDAIAGQVRNIGVVPCQTNEFRPAAELPQA